MKIALCGRFHTKKRHQGGSAEVFLSLAKELSKRHDLTLFGRGKPVKEIRDMCEDLKIKYYYIPSDSLINILLGPLRALDLLRRHYDNFDIIHTHTGSFAFASIFFRSESKIITHVHEVLIPHENPLLPTAYLYMENFLLRLSARNSDLTITVGDYMETLIRKKWKIDKIKAIKNGVDLELFKFRQKVENISNLFGKDKFKLLFVGRLTRRKGIIELIDAFKYLKSVKIKLLIIGDGDLYSVVKKKTLGSNKFKLIRFIENKNLPYYYSAADLVIVPSHYEPGSLVPRESLACGTPVLLANNTGLKEIKTGFFINKVEPKMIANSIKKVIKAAPFSREKCRDYAIHNYDWKKIVNRYEVEYKELLKQQ